ISYCRRGGIRVEGSEIRNFQVTGCDIEYNNYRAFQKEFPGQEDVPTAEIYIDVSQEKSSVREGTISSCTIQATRSPGGSNIRFIGRGTDGNHKVGMWTISGNLIGSQDNNIHLTDARGVTITGNYIYSGHHRNLLVEHCRNIVVGSNCFGHNPDYRGSELATGVRLVDSVDCNLSGLIIQDAQAGRHTVEGAVPVERKGLLEIVRCERITVGSTQVTDAGEPGIYLEDCSDTVLTGCTVIDSREQKLMPVAVEWNGDGRGNLVTGCRFGSGTAGNPEFPAHVTTHASLLDN
ncbi:MAG: hypothetical protein KDA79_16110, partial [Planctomycetaceae bacterium]|nr:hypothetical protein [Planctomycetaceae bacterium]